MAMHQYQDTGSNAIDFLKRLAAEFAAKLTYSARRCFKL